jgi:hypothetical protein
VPQTVRGSQKDPTIGGLSSYESGLLNRHAKELNAEGNDSAAYQAAWDPE